jgi:hypothetical protein
MVESPKLGYSTLRLAYSLTLLAVVAAITYFISNNGGPDIRAILLPSTTVEELLKHSNQYDGKIVKVDGMVVGSFGIMGLGGFRLRDPASRREILVVTSSGIPQAGNSILVFGRFRQTLSIGSYQYAVVFMNSDVNKTIYGVVQWWRSL